MAFNQSLADDVFDDVEEGTPADAVAPAEEQTVAEPKEGDSASTAADQGGGSQPDKPKAEVTAEGETAKTETEKPQAEAEDFKSKYESVAPVAEKVEKAFGGNEGFEIAERLYTSIVGPEEFNDEWAADAIEGLIEINPQAAEGLLSYITKQVGVKSAEKVFAEAFGRKLSDEEIVDLQEYLATNGAKAKKGEDGEYELPDELTHDDEGNPLPKSVTDFVRATLKREELRGKELEELKKQIGETGKKLDEGLNAVETEKVEKAKEVWLQSNVFDIIEGGIKSLKLDQKVDGETPEQSQERLLRAKAVEILTMGLFGDDAKRSGLYSEGLKFAAASIKSKADGAKAANHGRRVQAAIEDSLKIAVKLIGGAAAEGAKTRQEQIEKLKDADKKEFSGGETGSQTQQKPQRKSDQTGDPFDDAEDEVADLVRRNQLGQSWVSGL